MHIIFCSHGLILVLNAALFRLYYAMYKIIFLRLSAVGFNGSAWIWFVFFHFLCNSLVCQFSAQRYDADDELFCIAMFFLDQWSCDRAVDFPFHGQCSLFLNFPLYHWRLALIDHYHKASKIIWIDFIPSLCQ